MSGERGTIAFTIDATQEDASDLQGRIDTQKRKGDRSGDAYIYFENEKHDAFISTNPGQDKVLFRGDASKWFSETLRARCILYATEAARSFNIGRVPLSEYVFAPPFELREPEIQFIHRACNDDDTQRLLNMASRRVVCISHVRRPTATGPRDLNFHVKFNVMIVVDKRTSETIDDFFSKRMRGA